MKTARDTVFAAMEAARSPRAEGATRVPAPAMPADPETVLAARVEQAGGRLQRARRTDWTREIEWPLPLDRIEHLYVCASERTQLPGRGVGISARAERDLAPLEVCVLRAHFAVVENGACWQVPAGAIERAAALLAEHLLVVVDANALVATLHQAYERIDLLETRFGWFLCGPSKTADIEQALVLGAHGPRTMSLVLMDE